MRTRNPRASAGFTFIELLVTAVVIGTAFVAATWSMSATMRTKAIYDKETSPAFFLAKEIYELADGLPREPSGITGVTALDDVVALDSLIDASFSPAVLASGAVAIGLEDFSQHVSLAVFDMSDPDTPTADAPEDGLPVDGNKLYRLDVLIRENGEDLDTFQWWINP
jgi:prepilin-type N-terminal cleavage/methylation domain-containing protein